jgi:hypothetical protein
VAPLVQWSSHLAKDTSPLAIPYLNEWYKYKTRLTKIPRGWTRYEDPQKTRSRQGFYFKHDSVLNQDFLYPIPIFPDDEAPQVISWEKILSCDTQKARFCSGPVVPQEPYLWMSGATCEWYDFVQIKNLRVPLFDPAGKKAGFLKLHDAAPVASARARNVYELVAISQGHSFATEFDRNYSYTIPSEYYNVLWVEWTDGIAYRKGLGRVFKEVWHEQDLEDIHLILG